MSFLFDENRPRKVYICGDLIFVLKMTLKIMRKDFWQSLKILTGKMLYVNLLPGLGKYLVH